MGLYTSIMLLVQSDDEQVAFPVGVRSGRGINNATPVRTAVLVSICCKVHVVLYRLEYVEREYD